LTEQPIDITAQASARTIEQIAAWLQKH